MKPLSEIVAEIEKRSDQRDDPTDSDDPVVGMDRKQSDWKRLCAAFRASEKMRKWVAGITDGTSLLTGNIKDLAGDFDAIVKGGE